MSKTLIEGADLTRRALHGATMGTRYSAIILAPPGLDTGPLDAALFMAVDRVDRQMSTWNPGSDLMRLNQEPPGSWLPLPHDLLSVLRVALEIGVKSGGLFDIAVGDLVGAWGFGRQGRTPDTARIAALAAARRRPAQECVELDLAGRRGRRLGAGQLDLSGIAKGYAVDRMIECLEGFGIERALVSLDGELRAVGLNADDRPWSVAVERPDHGAREPMGVIELQDVAVATSGDYRHWVSVGGSRLSHTMDPRRGGPARNRVASVTVVHPLCVRADAWATALMVAGEDAGPALARERGLNALFALRDGPELRQIGVGPMFG